MKRLLILTIILAVSFNDANCYKVNRIEYKQAYDVIETVIRIRSLYPPGVEGRIKLWNKYNNKL